MAPSLSVVPAIVVIMMACPATARVTAPDAQRQWETFDGTGSGSVSGWWLWAPYILIE